MGNTICVANNTCERRRDTKQQLAKRPSAHAPPSALNTKQVIQKSAHKVVVQASLRAQRLNEKRYNWEVSSCVDPCSSRCLGVGMTEKVNGRIFPQASYDPLGSLCLSLFDPHGAWGRMRKKGIVRQIYSKILDKVISFCPHLFIPLL